VNEPYAYINIPGIPADQPSFSYTPAIRTERRFGVTAKLTAQQRRNLFQIRNSEAWADVLDVMEMCCIEIETKLINTDADREAEVLANHKMAKAAWLIFTHLQQKLDDEISQYLNTLSRQPAMPELTQEEQLIEHILDPTRPMPSEE
jgi:hypothetical protein